MWWTIGLGLWIFAAGLVLGFALGLREQYLILALELFERDE